MTPEPADRRDREKSTTAVIAPTVMSWKESRVTRPRQMIATRGVNQGEQSDHPGASRGLPNAAAAAAIPIAKSPAYHGTIVTLRYTGPSKAVTRPISMPSATVAERPQR